MVLVFSTKPFFTLIVFPDLDGFLSAVTRAKDELVLFTFVNASTFSDELLGLEKADTFQAPAIHLKKLMR